MRYESVHLGFSTADGEHVRLQFDRGELVLTFTDWQEKMVTTVFRDVLEFRWSQELSEADVPRDDTTYEVADSPELARAILLNGIADAGGYAHYKLCFNACGILDVVCKRV